MIKALKRNWILLLIAVVSSIAFAYIYMRLSEKLYSASSIILIEESKSNTFETMFNESVIGKQNDPNIENEIILLNSASLIQQTIYELNANVSYSYTNELGLNRLCSYQPFNVLVDTSKFQVINSHLQLRVLTDSTYKIELIDQEKNLSLVDNSEIISFEFDQPIQGIFDQVLYTTPLTVLISKNDGLNVGDVFLFEIHDIETSLNFYKSNLNIQEHASDASAIRITLKHHDPRMAKIFIDSLVANYLERDLNHKKLKFENQIAFIDSRIDDIINELYKSELDLQDFHAKNQSIDLSYTSKKLYDALYDKEYEKEMLSYNVSYYNYLFTRIQENDLDGLVLPSIVGIDDVALNNLVIELTNAKIAQNEAKEKYTANNEILTDLNNKIIYLKNSIAELLESTLNASELKVKELNEATAKIENEVYKLPESQRELIEIKRGFELNNDVYTFLLQKEAEANIQMASILSDKRIVDEARLDSSTHIYPVSRNIYVFSFILFFGIVLVFIVVKTVFFGKIDSIELLEASVQNGVVLGTMEHCKKNELINSIDISQKSFPYEKMRMIKSNLDFYLKQKDHKVVGITSMIQGEGKSFISRNLSVNHTSKKVALIDLDLRKNNSYKSGGDFAESSAFNEITDSIKVFENKEDNVTTFIFEIPESFILNFLNSSELKQMVLACRNEFDLVLIDLPPAGLFADYLSLNPIIDCSLFIVRNNYTPINQIASLKNYDRDNSYFLLNDLREANKSQNYYSYYTKYAN